MALNRLIKLVFNPCLFQRDWLRSGIEILIVDLSIFLVLNFNLFGQGLIDLQQVPLIDSLFLVEVVHDEKVFSLMRHDIDHVYLVEIRLLIVNDVPEVVCVLKDILRWIHKHLQLIRDKHLQGYQEYILLLVQDHRYVSEPQAFEFDFLQRNSVKLILRSSVVVKSPDLLFRVQYLNNLLLFLLEIL